MRREGKRTRLCPFPPTRHRRLLKLAATDGGRGALCCRPARINDHLRNECRCRTAAGVRSASCFRKFRRAPVRAIRTAVADREAWCQSTPAMPERVRGATFRSGRPRGSALAGGYPPVWRSQHVGVNFLRERWEALVEEWRGAWTMPQRRSPQPVGEAGRSGPQRFRPALRRAKPLALPGASRLISELLRTPREPRMRHGHGR